MQDASPLESWEIIEGRFSQPFADDAAFCVLMFIRDISLLKVKRLH
jgi:hypothetical protein